MPAAECRILELRVEDRCTLSSVSSEQSLNLIFAKPDVARLLDHSVCRHSSLGWAPEVLTKHAATECMENDRCATRRQGRCRENIGGV